MRLVSAKENGGLSFCSLDFFTIFTVILRQIRNWNDKDFLIGCNTVLATDTSNLHSITFTLLAKLALKNQPTTIFQHLESILKMLVALDFLEWSDA